MTTKIKKKKNVEVSQISPIEAEFIRMVDKIFKEKNIELQEIEIKKIIKELLPDIDALISKKVKQHFYEFGSFLVEKFKP